MTRERRRPVHLIKDDLLEAEARFHALLESIASESANALSLAMRDVANFTGELWASDEFIRERNRMDFAGWAGEELDRARDRRMLDRAMHWSSNIVAHKIASGDEHFDVAEIVRICWEKVQELEVAYKKSLVSKREEL